MRIAVSLPSLSPQAVERAQIEAAIRALAELAEVEVFGETTRIRQGDLPAPGYHYLRLGDRHAAAPFAAALHPIGRDFWPYEPPVLLARQFPSVAWLLDTSGHHVLIGALLGHGRWDQYVALLEAQRDAGAAQALTVARGWGTRALFRATDPLPTVLAANNHLLAANAEMARQVGGDTPVVPLPTTAAELQPPTYVSDGVRRVAVIAPNLSWPLPELRSLAAVLGAHPALRVSFHIIDVFAPGIRHAAARLGVEDRIDWVVEGSLDGRRAMADAADVVVVTTGDPTLNDRALVQRAMAAGQVAVVTRAPLWDDLPAGAIVVETGREREVALRETLLELVADAGLAAALGSAAKHAGDAVAAATTAALLLEHLQAQAAVAPPQLRRSAAAAFVSSRQWMIDHCTPHNAAAATRARVRDRLDRVLPDNATTVAGHPR
jgi:hypothetical protein